MSNAAISRSMSNAAISRSVSTAAISRSVSTAAISRWEGWTLSAGGSEIAMETLEIVHEGIEPAL